jgi:NADPH:quinone reductase-like Zn-dependent oxidoreductase
MGVSEIARIKENIAVEYMAAKLELSGSEALDTFTQLIDEGQVKVTIATTFPLSEAAKAHKLREAGHGRGRIVLHIA